MYNLTENQKEIARWLVNSVRERKLDEEFPIKWITPYKQTSPVLGLPDYRGEINEIIDLTQGSLKALVQNNLLLLNVKFCTHETWDCTLTGHIYTAVDNDFNSPDTSFIDYLTPLANPSGFDEELANRCFPILATGGSNPKSWDTATRNAGVVLEARLRDVGSISNHRVGRDLVNDVFGKNGTLVPKFSVDSEREGYRDLYAGIVGVFRNTSAHHFKDPSPEEGGAFIVFVNLLLKKLEDLR